MADLFGIGEIIGSAIDAGTSLWNSERNLAFQKENLAYQKELQQQILNREDTAVQRRAADLKAAGINPLLAAGGAASSGAAVQTTAPQASAKTNFAQTAMALHRMKIDNSMTHAQQQLINENANNARKQGELLDMQIQWYKDNPSFAPGVPYTPSMVNFTSNRLGTAIGEFFGKRSVQKANPTFDSLTKYYMSIGDSPSEATARANRVLNKINKKGG